MLGPNKFHLEGWALYRNFYDRFNFENHDVSNVSFGGHIAVEIIPKTLPQHTAPSAASVPHLSVMQRCGKMAQSSFFQSRRFKQVRSGIRRLRWISTLMQGSKKPARHSPT
jgi:hypothetical protein